MTTDNIFNQSPQVKDFDFEEKEFIDRPIYLYNSLQINQVFSEQRVNTIEYQSKLNSLEQLNKIDNNNDEKYEEINGKF